MLKISVLCVLLNCMPLANAVITRSGLDTAVKKPLATLAKERFEARAVPVAYVPKCDLTNVTELSLFGPFDTWKQHVSKLSPEDRAQIRHLRLYGSRGMVGIEAVDRTLDLSRYLNRCKDEPGIDFTALALFPALETVEFNWVRNFNVRNFTDIQWPTIRRFEFPYMRVGSNLKWLTKLQAPQLTDLDLSGNIISVNQIERVLEDLSNHCPALQTIDLRGNSAFAIGEYTNEDSFGMQVLARENGDSEPYTPEVRWNQIPDTDEPNIQAAERIRTRYNITVYYDE